MHARSAPQHFPQDIGARSDGSEVQRGVAGVVGSFEKIEGVGGEEGRDGREVAAGNGVAEGCEGFLGRG